MPYLAFGAGPPASAAAGVHDGSCQSGWSAAPVRDPLAGSAGAALSGVRGRPRTRHVVGCVDGRPGPGPRRGNPGRVRHRCGRDGGVIGRLGGGGSGPAGGSVPRAGEGRAPLGARLLAPLMWLLDPLLRPRDTADMVAFAHAEDAFDLGARLGEITAPTLVVAGAGTTSTHRRSCGGRRRKYRRVG